MEPEMKNENEAPKPGTKDALKLENAALEAEVAELKAQLEAMKSKPAESAGEAAPAPEEPVRMVTVKIPRVKKDQEDVFVRVNRRTYLIKVGVAVEVPWFVAEVLQHRDEMLDVIMEYDAQHKDKNQ